MRHRRSAGLTFVDHMLASAAGSPDLPILTYLVDGEEQEETISYAALARRATAVGQLLTEQRLAGSRVLLLFPPGLDYIVALLGAMCAAAVAVPVLPPEPTRLGHTLAPLQSIARDARPSAVATTAALRDAIAPMVAQLPELAGLPWIAVDEVSEDRATQWCRPDISEDSLVMCQYTSGSVGDPKGVLLSHGNLMHNKEAIRHIFGHRDGTPSVLWLPHTFDMGSHSILQTLYQSIPLTLMSPLAFLHKPVRWLRTISRLRATTSGGPSFAYELCVQRISPAQREGLDLSSWEVAFNGAEQVRPDTLDRFVESFGPHGFDRRAFLCCYGSAEMTLIATGGPRGSGPRYAHLDAAALQRDEIAEAVDGQPARTLVACGEIPEGVRLRIVDTRSLIACPADTVGEIWIDGPSKAVGYFDRPEESAEHFQARLPGDDGRYLRTGDLGFLRDGQLYITGRRAELLIINGRNHYAHDLERTAERAHAAVRADGCAAFSILVGTEERIVVIAEVDRRQQAEDDNIVAIRDSIKRLVAAEHDVRLHDVRLVRRGAVLKTSSGKVRRHACRTAFLDGQFDTADGGT